MTLEVMHRHEKLVPESSVEFRPVALITGAGFWSVCQALYICRCDFLVWYQLSRVVLAYVEFVVVVDVMMTCNDWSALKS